MVRITKIGIILSTLITLASSTLASSTEMLVKLEFYGEALWPECGMFVGNELHPALTTPGILDIVDFSFIPFGNSYYNIAACPSSGTYDHSVRMCWNAACNQTDAPDDCFSGDLICQHGKQECYANRVEACAIKHYQMNTTKFLNFITCYESTNEPSNSSMISCANQSEMDVSTLTECASNTSAEGRSLDSLNAKQTCLIPGGHASTPWPLLNGKPQQAGLLQAICSAYTGSNPPEACQ